MKAAEQLPRNALVWIVLSQFSLVIPHLGRLPVWVLLVYVVAAAWRVQVYQGRWSFPGRLMKAALVLTAVAGVLISYRTMIGLEPTVAFLLAAFALKLIELAQRKDAYVLLFLAYFVCATEFLFSQSLFIMLYSVLNVVLITTALIALHKPGEDRFNAGTVRLASVMLLQSLPLMLVLFFLFPRFGPLWSVPIKSHAAKSGVSDFMRPGDISSLGLSAEVAFRVEFEGDIPPRSELYWRGLVFSSLQADTWRSLPYHIVPVEERRRAKPVVAGEPLRYSIILEPTQQNWLYALRYPQSPDLKVMQSHDFRLVSPTIIEDEYHYEVETWPDALLDEDLSDWRRETETTLPPALNERSRELAQQMRDSAGSDREFITALLDRFTNEPFVYTLQPPLLGENTVDEFMFQTRRGFCEHYAYAFVYLARAGGVPARVVAGYQGGEINPVNGTVIVHQFDAHAWAEVWLEGEGWVRVDPTAAVSPERIEYGLEAALLGEGSFLADSPLSPLRFRGVNWINTLRLQYDALTWRWQSLIVGYDRDTQYQFLSDVLGEISAKKFVLVMLGSWALVLIPVGLSLLLKRKTRPISKPDRLYQKFCQRLVPHGVARLPGEAPSAFAQRAAAQIPARATEINAITSRYISLAYAQNEPSGKTHEELRALARAVRMF